jgi:predicted nucleotidyltransferase
MLRWYPVEKTGPTRFEDLDDVLATFLTGAREILGENFCGAYLQGSFALGDADEHSDVDFMVVTEDEVTESQADGLQALHERLYRLETPWAQHLEGSYISREKLRRVDPVRTPLLYLDNGATQLERDTHCNTAVVRWTLREHGVVLAGPDPKSLIDPIGQDDLVNDVLVALAEWEEWLGAHTMSRRGLGVLVLTLCRMLQSVAEGRVTTKREAGEWALRNLGPEWSSLVQWALDDRPDPWTKAREPADPANLTQTLALLDYVFSAARHAAGTRRE